MDWEAELLEVRVLRSRGLEDKWHLRQLDIWIWLHCLSVPFSHMVSTHLQAPVVGISRLWIGPGPLQHNRRSYVLGTSVCLPFGSTQIVSIRKLMNASWSSRGTQIYPHPG